MELKTIRIGLIEKTIKSLGFANIDDDTASEIAIEIDTDLGIMENAALDAFKRRIKSVPNDIIDPAEILVNTLNDREYLLCMHFGNKIIDAMLEYAHRLVTITERQYEDRMSSGRLTKTEFAKIHPEVTGKETKSAYDLNEVGGFKPKQ